MKQDLETICKIKWKKDKSIKATFRVAQRKTNLIAWGKQGKWNGRIRVKKDERENNAQKLYKAKIHK